MSYKVCINCKNNPPRGYTLCRECDNERRRLQYHQNKEKEQEKRTRWREENREYKRLYDRNKKSECYINRNKYDFCSSLYKEYIANIKRKKSDRKRLKDWYVVEKIIYRTVLKSKDIPKELIQLKKEYMKLTRQINIRG